MQAFAGLKRGRVALGVLQSLGAYRLPGLLAQFHARFAGIEMVLREDVTENLLEQVKAGELDVALTHTIGDIFPLHIADSHLMSRALAVEDILLVAHPQHPLALQAQISPEHLRDEAFILFKPGSGLRQAVMYLGQAGGFVPRILFESGDNGTIRGLAAEGLGLSVLPRSVVDAPGKAIVTLQLAPPLPARTIVAVWHRRIAHSAAASAFLNFLHEDFHLSA